MRLSVQYTAQLRPLVGRSEEFVVLPAGSSLDALLTHLAAREPAAAPHLLTSAGHVRPSLLVAINGCAVASHAASVTSLAEGDVVTLLPPIAGG
jgi:molybdopterin synthase sulfur carrier subunit